MKKEYITPEIEICQLHRIDIICASGDDVDLDYGGVTEENPNDWD